MQHFLGKLKDEGSFLENTDQQPLRRVEDLAREIDIEVEFEFEKIKKEMNDFWKDVKEIESEEDENSECSCTYCK